MKGKKTGKFFYDKYCSPKPKKISSEKIGRLEVNVRGFGFVIPEDKENPNDPDIFIDPENMNGAIHGDRVKVRIISRFAGKLDGIISEIVEPSNENIVGILIKSGKKYFVRPDDRRLDFKIEIPKLKETVSSNTKVVVKIISRTPFRAKIIEILGKVGEEGIDILSILRAHNVDEDFPDDVKSLAAKVEISPSPEEISKRIDRRNLKIVTIDGEDAKDLDDGVFAERRGEKYFLGVYIADVSHYVRPQSPLDREAYRRGTSIYPVDRVVPMLPTELSNGICSLNAGTDRLSMACEMELDSAGNVTDHKIFPTVIHVHRRLSYTQVNKFLDGDRKELADCAENLDTLTEIYNLRKKIREKRGSIDFDLPELKIVLDEKGKPVEIAKKIRGTAEAIIEECMLAANETVAEHTIRKKIPSLYRIHELPEKEKLTLLNRFLSHFSLHINSGGNGQIHPREFQRIIKSVDGKKYQRVVSSFVLRTMQQARYSAENTGHFGLAATFYTHFTSPIRRYPDLIVHRMLKLAATSPEKLTAAAGNLQQIAVQTSKCEREAVAIERETDDLKSTEYMSRFIGEKFDGTISGVTRFGFFVELENGIDGLVPVTELPGDYYEYVESEFALIGLGTGKSFRIGDSVRVKLIDTDINLRRITFRLLPGVAAKNLIAGI